MVKVSLCFYENPAAIQEIKFWESLVKKDIISSAQDIESGDDVFSYILKKIDHYELMICIPMSKEFYTIEKVEALIGNHLSFRGYDSIDLLYKKTLVFGKIDYEFTQFAAALLDFYETQKHSMRIFNNATN